MSARIVCRSLPPQVWSGSGLKSRRTAWNALRAAGRGVVSQNGESHSWTCISSTVGSRSSRRYRAQTPTRRGSGLLSYEPVGDSERRRPSRARSPNGRPVGGARRARSSSTKARTSTSCRSCLHWDLAPGVRDEQDSVMVGCGVSRPSTPTMDGAAASKSSSFVGGRQVIRPFHVLVDLDPKSKAGPLERVQVVVRAAHIVVPLAVANSAGPRGESRPPAALPAPSPHRRPRDRGHRSGARASG